MLKLAKMKNKSIPGLAIGMGAIAGMRPMMTLAILAFSIRRGWIRPGHSPYANILSASGAKRIVEFAISELVADKLPFTRSRLDALPLVWRTAAGAICGATIQGTVKKSVIEGAVLGALGALAGAVTGYYFRKRLDRDMPDVAVALLEDALALGAGATIIILSAAGA